MVHIIAQVLLSVWDKDLIGSDDLIGDMTLNVEAILAEIIPPSSDSAKIEEEDGGRENAGGEVSAHCRGGGVGGEVWRHEEWYALYEDAARSKMTGEVLLEVTASERLQFRGGEVLSIDAKGGVQRLGQGAFFQLCNADGGLLEGGSAEKSQQGPCVVHVQARLLPLGHESVGESAEDKGNGKDNGKETVTAQQAGPVEIKLKVHVVGGKSLKAMDRGGTSDPYVTLQVGSLGHKKTDKRRKAQTKVVKKCLAPEWDEEFDVLVMSDELEQQQVLSLQVLLPLAA